MGTCLSLRRMSWNENEITAARQTAVVSLGGIHFAERIILPQFQVVNWEPPVRLKFFVNVQPRKFQDIAGHFTKVARPIEWPMDEPDIE